eukprot:362840-Chlamydomonas_euryale.AAC.2
MPSFDAHAHQHLQERPDLEETKDRLVVSIGNDKRQLLDLEDKVLKLLRESTGNILDDEVRLCQVGRGARWRCIVTLYGGVGWWRCNVALDGGAA